MSLPSGGRKALMVWVALCAVAALIVGSSIGLTLFAHGATSAQAHFETTSSERFTPSTSGSTRSEEQRQQAEADALAEAEAEAAADAQAAAEAAEQASPATEDEAGAGGPAVEAGEGVSEDEAAGNGEFGDTGDEAAVDDPFPADQFPNYPPGATLPSVEDPTQPLGRRWAPDSWCASGRAWIAETSEHYCY